MIEGENSSKVLPYLLLALHICYWIPTQTLCAK